MHNATSITIRGELADIALRLRERRLDLGEFVARAYCAETMTPLIDPSRYQLSGEQLSAALTLGRAAREFALATQAIPQDWLEDWLRASPAA